VDKQAVNRFPIKTGFLWRFHVVDPGYTIYYLISNRYPNVHVQ